MRYFLTLTFVCFLLTGNNLQAKTYNVDEFAAINDGKTINTKAIQNAIDQCTKNGGGTVLFSGGGKYVSGTIYLKDNVTLYIENGTTLLGSPNFEDYTTDTYKNMYKNEPQMDKCLIFAKDAKSIAIEGHGTIDGNGFPANFPKGRPMLFRFLNCTNLHLTDINIINPAAWSSAWLYCDNITVTGINIRSRVNWNGDGLDFDGCTNVHVSNCSFDNSDDCICLQTSRTDKPCRNVVISNCVFTTQWGGIRIGLLSRGEISFVTVTNCTFRNINDSGLKIQMNEGAEMKNMVFSNLVMENVPRPVFMTFCQQRACVDAPMELAPMEAMHHFIFQNIIVDNSKGDKNSAFLLSGLPNNYIEDILIKDVYFIVSGGGTKEDADKKKVNEYTPEVLKGGWPEFYGVGTLPACGIYARHIKGLTLNNINVKTIIKDVRPTVLFNDVPNIEVSELKVNGQKMKSDNYSSAGYVY